MRGTGGFGTNTSDTDESIEDSTGARSSDGQDDDGDGAPDKNRIKKGSGRADERSDTAELD